MKPDLPAGVVALAATCLALVAAEAWETAGSAPSTAPPTLARVLGGWAPAVASVCWLRANLAWEAENELSVRAWAQAAMATEPERPLWRVNYARMVAFDFVQWRVRKESLAPDAWRRTRRRAAADEAIALLLAAPAVNATLEIEAANIALYGRNDPELAAELYHRAALRPDAPWHAGRIHAELLRQLGREREAISWLRAWLPRLPRDDPPAQYELVAARLAELEARLRARGEAL